MVAYIKELAVSRKRWLSEPEFKNGIVLAQSIPGATAMQVAAYVGLRIQGIRGALASYIGFGLPAFLIMLAFSVLFSKFRNIPLVASAFNGLQVIVVAITFNAVLGFGKSLKRDLTNLLFVLASTALFWSGISPFWVILISALAGILFMRAEPSPEISGTHCTKNTWFHKGIWILLGTFLAGLIALYFANDRLFELATVMVQIDAFAFGGGFSSLPLMLQKVVNVHGWMSNKTFMDGIALGQITPGPIIITATFVGYLLQGFPGAVIASIAIFTPSFLILVLVDPLFNRFRTSPYFIKAMEGVFACFVGLLLFVGVKFFRDVSWDITRASLALAVMIALLRKIDILYIVLAGTVLSVALL